MLGLPSAPTQQIKSDMVGQSGGTFQRLCTGWTESHVPCTCQPVCCGPAGATRLTQLPLRPGALLLWRQLAPVGPHLLQAVLHLQDSAQAMDVSVSAAWLTACLLCCPHTQAAPLQAGNTGCALLPAHLHTLPPCCFHTCMASSTSRGASSASPRARTPCRRQQAGPAQPAHSR